MKLSHIDSDGRARMVDVSHKPISRRTARAAAEIEMAAETIEIIRGGDVPKGDVFAVAKIAGINAAKQTGSMIPLCHPIVLDHVDVSFKVMTDRVQIETTVTCVARTGVEMEALAAAAGAALGVYDMCKAVDKNMCIQGIRLLEKTKEPVG